MPRSKLYHGFILPLNALRDATAAGPHSARLPPPSGVLASAEPPAPILHRYPRRSAKSGQPANPAHVIAAACRSTPARRCFLAWSNSSLARRPTASPGPRSAPVAYPGPAGS